MVCLNPVRPTCLHLMGLLFACGLAACSPNAAAVVEAEYPKAIVGSWQGQVDGENETISFGADGEFQSLVRSGGFISMTLGQGATGTIRGTWAIKGKSITLKISSTEDERVSNSVASATIETLNPNELFVKSDTGVTSTFVRLIQTR
jgi:hypothetical protein